MKKAKELEVITKLDFNKQDIVTVAMAKIEALIRKNVRDFKAKRDKLETKINDANKQIKTLGENNPPKDMIKKLDQIEKAFKAAGISRMLGVRIEFILAAERNNYDLKITKRNESGELTHESINIIYKSIRYTNPQNNLVKSIEKMTDERGAAIDDGIKWKSKLSDMSAVERQMRAKVVEAELNRTAEGRALVDILTKNYEETIKLIEM